MLGRSRWIAVGAVVATLVGSGSLLTASAAGSPLASSFVPITPCRLFDTRASDNIGPRATPLGPNETYVTAVWGTNGNCTIPSGVTGVSISVAIINPSASSYLTVFPADVTRPLSSNLNWVAGQAPTPNSVTAALSADGKLALYNLAGTVDLLVDIVGYYELSTSGPAGPPGPPGAKGDTGDPGPRPAQIVWVASSGGDFTTVSAALASISDNATRRYVIKVAPGTFVEPAGIDLKDNVDIEGSGQSATTITATSAASNNTTVRAPAGTLHGELRNLTITNTGGGATAVALRVTNVTPSGAFRISNVTAAASGATNSYGTYVDHAAPIITDLTSTATGSSNSRGFVNDAASPTVNHLVAQATGGSASSYAVVNQAGASPTMSDVTATSSGSPTNYGVYNTASTPTLRNVTASASGGTTANRGVMNASSNAVMSDLVTTAIGNGGGYADAIRVDGSTVTLSNITATASGSTATNYGVMASTSTVAILDSTLSGSGASSAGVAIEGSTVSVIGSYMTGGTASIGAFSGTGKVVQSVFLGGAGVQAGGSLTCTDVYKSDLVTPANATCG